MSPGPSLPALTLAIMSILCFLLSAPSQPPVKVMWNTSNSKIILNWEQVKALENESEVTGYKVSARSLAFVAMASVPDP